MEKAEKVMGDFTGVNHHGYNNLVDYVHNIRGAILVGNASKCSRSGEPGKIQTNDFFHLGDCTIQISYDTSFAKGLPGISIGVVGRLPEREAIFQELERIVKAYDPGDIKIVGVRG